MLKSPEILVPMDFSPCSVNALRVAVGMAAPDGDLTLLHVVDEDFVRAAVAAGMGSTEDVRRRLKEQAEASFPNVLEGLDVGQVDRGLTIGVDRADVAPVADLLVAGADA